MGIVDSGDIKRATAAAEADPVAVKSKEDAAWRRLSLAARGRKASKIAVQEWTADHLDSPVSDIRGDSVPSPGAISFLKWARENPEKFYKEYYGKISAAAAKNQPTDGRLNEDGRSIPEILQQFERARRELAQLSGRGK